MFQNISKNFISCRSYHSNLDGLRFVVGAAGKEIAMLGAQVSEWRDDIEVGVMILEPALPAHSR